MSFNNLNWLWAHLPEHVRAGAGDNNFLLRRFLAGFCAELDAADAAHDSLHLNLSPDTAPAEFIEFWLSELLGWGWFPGWFTLAQRRSFYRNIARHYARRGTARGIVEFLLEFGIRSRVTTRPEVYGEWTLGEAGWLITGPLVVVIEIFPTKAGVAQEQSYAGEWALGEDPVAEQALVPTRPDIDQLLRWQKPVGQFFIIEEHTAQ
ncbi:MAG TPA: hypothetical protein VIP46_22090 [Pyrinomonadaceae bacterium]